MPFQPALPIPHTWLDQLHANGYRVTAPRRAVVEIMATHQRALNPYQVFDLARRRYPALGLVTVYRTLEKLEALGLIERVHQPHGCHAYLPAAIGHQHLLLCAGCGQAEYFSGDDLETLIAGIAARTGFHINEHWLQLFGMCRACQHAQP
ncbi:MAG: transcriptional repressor [Anaerolineales bacterium]|nr:transcriptional repressor [Anaerolineales bacterium]